jgi:hypothetical protein
MEQLVALATAITVALGSSTLTVAAIHGPLRRQLVAACPVDSTAAFWMRAAVAVLYLVPLFVVLVFGLPDFTLHAQAAAEVMRRTIAAAAFALAAIVIGIGLRLSSLRSAR